MTYSEDLSTPRLMRRYLRQVRWQWRHAKWRTDRDIAFFDWGQRVKSQIYDERFTDLRKSHRLLEQRGWPVPKAQA